jgi:hypothetical protein
MFIPFDEIQPSSRVWVYQSNRKFTAHEKTIIDSELQLFTEDWKAHGHPLGSSFTIRHDQFIILAADEAYHAPSGCSIDDSVRTIQQLGQKLGVDFFNRNLIAFKMNDIITLIPLSELKQKYQAGFWNESTPMFNNLVQTKVQLESDWTIPSANTWLKRYVPVEKMAP